MHVSKNNMMLGGVVGVVLLGASFWGGMSYAKGSGPMRLSGQGGNFTLAEGAMGGQFMGRGATGMRGGVAGGFTAGQIISQDQNGVTIKMTDGSTKIILVSGSTEVAKQAAGSAADLTVGTTVTVTGTTNSDGSVTASVVQIRPAMSGR